MLYSLCADEALRQLLYFSRLAAEHHYLQTVFMIEVRMQGRNDDCVTLVLEIGKLLRQQPGVMIVNESDGANDKRVAGHNDRAYEPVTNQIAKRLGPIVVPLVRDERIEPV
jgi:hypothetical protein